MGQDTEKDLRGLAGIDENYVIQNVKIGSHGQVLIISCDGGRVCKQIGVTLNSVNQIVICKDVSCSIDSLDDDIIGFRRSGFWLTDLVNEARLNNQRYCLAKKIYKLIMVSEIVGEELSEAQISALKRLQHALDQKNLFIIEGEREMIFRIIIGLDSSLKTIEDVQGHKSIANLRKVLHCNGNQEFNTCGMLQIIFNL
jgi:hypothetical protein